ncbi:MAG: hypothetical protein R2728_10320 [Chitinophagales bacterium]
MTLPAIFLLMVEAIVVYVIVNHELMISDPLCDGGGMQTVFTVSKDPYLKMVGGR